MKRRSVSLKARRAATFKAPYSAELYSTYRSYSAKASPDNTLDLAMTEAEFLSGLDRLRKRTMSVIWGAMLFNLCVVMPIFVYGVLSVRNHSPTLNVMILAGIGLTLCGATFWLLVILLRAVDERNKLQCPYCGVRLTWKDRSSILNSKACPSCSQHLFASGTNHVATYHAPDPA